MSEIVIGTIVRRKSAEAKTETETEREIETADEIVIPTTIEATETVTATKKNATEQTSAIQKGIDHLAGTILRENVTTKTINILYLIYLNLQTLTYFIDRIAFTRSTRLFLGALETGPSGWIRSFVHFPAALYAENLNVVRALTSSADEPR